jgi:hypothetical protein
MPLDRKDEWLAARLEDLDYGDIDGICRAARAYPLEGVKKDELETAITTLRCQQASRPEDRICTATCNHTPAAWPAKPAKRSCLPTNF